jgi:TPP-dependent pyruvate/acetoin dehydrogenase alpha subunit
LLELRIARMTSHSSQDDDLYRSEEQRAAAVRSDPLPALRRDLISRGALSDDLDAKLVRETRAEVAQAEQRAAEQPEPAPERARRWLYAGDPYMAEDASG